MIPQKKQRNNIHIYTTTQKQQEYVYTKNAHFEKSSGFKTFTASTDMHAYGTHVISQWDPHYLTYYEIRIRQTDY
jgi:hypothetical protein